MGVKADYGKKTTTSIALLLRVQEFHRMQGLWPTIDEMAVIFQVKRRIINDKLRMLRWAGTATLRGDTIEALVDEIPEAPVHVYHVSKHTV